MIASHALGVAVSAAVAIAAPPVETLTRAAAEKLTTEQLARRVLGLAGASMREAQVITSGPPVGSPYRLAAIAFTPGGRTSGWPGLCAATATTISFHPAGQNDPSPDPDSLATAPDTHALWSLLAQATPTNTPDWTERYKAEVPLCAARGPVLTDDGSWFRATWADMRELLPNEMNFAAGLLRQLDRPSPQTGKAARCDGGGVEGCPDASRALGRIDMLRPARVDLAPCSATNMRVCVTIEVERKGLAGIAGDYTQVMVETDAPGPFTDDYRILSVTLSRRGWVV